MAKSRMAGEALSDAQRNRQIREEIGSDSERLSQRISGVDRDKYDLSGYTDKEINMALQGSTFGDEDYARLTGKSIGGDEDKPADSKPPSNDTPTSSAPSTPAPITLPGKENNATIGVPGMPGGPFGSQMQNVIQNNSVNSTVTGDNNTVENSQDNNVSQSGGSDYASRYARGLKNQYVLNLLGK